MKLFIYEHITSGALINQVLPASLEHEGNLMLNAIVNDFAQLADVQITILRDARLSDSELNHPQILCHRVDNEISFKSVYQAAIQQSDFVLAIAPETDFILQNIEQDIMQLGAKSLGCQVDAIRHCSDKLLCFQVLKRNKITTPFTCLASEWSLSPFDSSTGYIIKPRDGAGCVDTAFYANKSELNAYIIETHQRLDNMIIQPFIEGKMISLSVLCSEHQQIVLSINQQKINLENGLLAFSGSTVNGIDDSLLTINEAVIITQQLHQAIPGLRGFIGIDAVITDNKVMIIDINPRLTTSYIGLHESLQTNPAELLLTMMNDNTLHTLTHRQAIEVSL